MHLRDLLAAGLESLAGRTLQPVEVAVLDSGIDATHPDLKGRVAACYAVEAAGQGWAAREREAGINNAVSEHGTAVASIIGRVAPNARIADIRVLDEHIGGEFEQMVEGLRTAVARGSPVINLSLAVLKAPNLAKLQQLCEEAYYADQIVVAAARNDRAGRSLPADLASCIGVDGMAAPSPFVIEYLARSQIEFKAQGVDVTVAVPGGGYRVRYGTSLATPVISALCALLKGAHPELTPFEIKTLLKSKA